MLRIFSRIIVGVSIISVTFITGCNKPDDGERAPAVHPQIISLTPTQATIQWAQIGSGYWYDVMVSDTFDQEGSLYVIREVDTVYEVGNDTICTIVNLTPGERYIYTVGTYSETLAPNKSEHQVFTTPLQ
jgi:hypothetical protein